MGDDRAMTLTATSWSEPPGRPAFGGQNEFMLPAGTVTLLLADMEGSVRAWERDREAMTEAVRRLDCLVDDMVGRGGGVRPEQQGEGDSFVAAFARASDAVAAALEIQLALAGAEWTTLGLRLRMGLHTGEVQLRDEANYVGSAVNRCGRLRSMAAGGQTLLSATTSDLVAERLPDGASLRDLGPFRLRDLARPERIHQLDHPRLVSVFPPLRDVDQVPNNLPTQLSSFVGRAEEIAEVATLLADARLVTLSGAGGCGKTRLALHVAAEQVDHYPDGVWFVDLAPHGEDTVAMAVLDALGLRADRGENAIDRIVRALATHAALLVVDNCEHVVAAAAGLVNELLRRCPTLSVLTTSRSPLGVDGEVVYRVPSLSLAGERAPLEALSGSDAVALFMDRARRARPNFCLTADNSVAVTRICRRLDGIPLAIELAAARVRVLSPDRILAGLDDRFRTLGAGPRTALPRQSTLAASVAWGHDLLSEPERVVFRRLAVFAGSFDLDAAEAVAAGGAIDRFDVLDLLASLVDRSLVSLADGADGDRYVLLETLRAFGRARLADAGEEADTRDRHLAWTVGLAEAAGPELTGPPAAKTRLRAFQDELVQALAWGASAADPVPVLRLCAALPVYASGSWLYRLVASTAMAALEAAPDAPAEVRARASYSAAYLSLLTGDAASAVALARQAAALGDAEGDLSTVARAYAVEAWTIGFADPDAGIALARRAADIATQGGDGWAQARATVVHGYLLVTVGPPDAAAVLAEGANLARKAGAPSLALEADVWRSVVLGVWGCDPRAARDLLTGIMPQLAEDGRLAINLCALAYAAIAAALCGDHAAAAAHIAEALSLSPAAEAAGNLMLTSSVYWSAGIVRHAAGDLDGAIDAYSKSLALPIPPAFTAVDDHTFALSGLALAAAGNADAARDQLARFYSRNPRQGLRPFAHLAEAIVARLDGAPDRAEDLAHEAFVRAHHQGMTVFAVDALELLAAIQAPAAPRDAARLLGTAQRLRDDVGYARRLGERDHHDALVARLVDVLGADDYDTARRDGATLDWNQAIEWVQRRRGRRNRPLSGWDSLTPTEARVATLVAEGATNATIGERFLMSPNTVKTHLAHIFTKLDVTNRAQLSHLVARHTSAADEA
jgi:predicted ATPase/class 3 adenylate cyclase/DNA-binding CsgD family transcriptional regulator